MKKLFVWGFVVSQIYHGNAQSNEIDSLTQALQREKTDTGRALLLGELSNVISESRPDTAMFLAMEALTLSRSIGFEKGEAMSLNRVGGVYGILGNYAKAMEFQIQSLKLNEKLNNLDGLRRNYGNIGGQYFSQGLYRQALYYQNVARILAEKLGDKKAQSIVLVNIGQAYLKLNLLDSAINFVQQSYNLAKSINYYRMLGSSLHWMGLIHTEEGQFSVALEFFRLSIPYLQKSNNEIKLCGSFLGMARIFEKTGQSDSSVFYGKRSLRLAKEKGFTLELRDAARFLSAFYRSRQMLDTAFSYVDISKAANDSLFSEKKNYQFQTLAFDETLRQQDIESAKIKAAKQRNHNLQYAAIAIGLISFIILFFLLSHSIIVKTRFISFLAVMGLLAVFEFINLFVHPYLSKWTNDSPVWMLVILMAIGALLVPVHHKLERWITIRMVEKNKKIRLEAARKTIANLEQISADLSSKALATDEASADKPTSAKASADKEEQTN